MQGRFQQDSREDEEEITEDFEHFEEEESMNYYSRYRMDSDSASPKCKGSRRRRSRDFKTKPQHEDEDDNCDRPEAKNGLGDSGSEEEEWDSQEEEEELCELQHNIAKLLQNMQEGAIALENNQADCKAAE
ncbi:Hypothetical protein PHPALM_10746 [Phytophthora palmivora]|uniref:Uncharacterized protein n=1 Tax=Phytophthora palmivora TaxID=4796 RepID=A0A2P4Y3Y8_9STRA|nr:Hypothetical protein PHPALM_10746 [Phytophthora palmivora]